jgi:hypothetical protein
MERSASPPQLLADEAGGSGDNDGNERAEELDEEAKRGGITHPRILFE